MDWLRVHKFQVEATCGAGNDACQLNHFCTVISHYREDEAKRVPICETNLWDHERWHVMYKLLHPMPVKPVTRC